MNCKVKKHVVAAVIRRCSEVLISERPKGREFAGYWEFPGGKVEPGESVFAALQRELKEELDIIVEHAQPFMTLEHEYDTFSILFDVHLVEQFEGMEKGCEGQKLCWVPIDELPNYTFPEANYRIIEKLSAEA